jgi:hypothetical protein
MDENVTDTIPVFENFCFALALFRQKSSESVLEGKEIIERLLAFQTEEGNFPVFLHEYPKCWDFHLGLKIAPVIIHVLREFSSVLNFAYKEKLESALKKMVRPPKSPSWELRYRACLGEELSFPSPDTPQEWFDSIVSDQLVCKGRSYPIPYDCELRSFSGDHPAQEKGEPQPLPIEYVLAEKDGFDKRLLRDHPNQIYSALLYPFTSSKETALTFFQQNDPVRILWRGETLHSFEIPKGIYRNNLKNHNSEPNSRSPKTDSSGCLGVKSDECITFELPDELEIGRDDLFEVLTYCDISPETTLYVNDQKGMVFYLGDTVSIRTPHVHIHLRFEILKGEGEFCGHISRANRPSQIACHGSNQYEAYDWQIGLRTLRRKGSCTVGCFYSIDILNTNLRK